MHASEPPTEDPPPSLFLHPDVQLLLCILLVTASELLLKRGAADTADPTSPASWLGVGSLSSGWVWLGIVCIVLSFASWMYVLHHTELSVAYTASASIYALVPLASWTFLGDSISAARWLGIALIVIGLGIIAPQLKKTEPKL